MDKIVTTEFAIFKRNPTKKYKFEKIANKNLSKIQIILKYKKIRYIRIPLHRIFADLNLNTYNADLFNNIYINVLYLILSILMKKCNCCIILYPIFNNIYYEIIYILSIYFENIKIYIKNARQ